MNEFKRRERILDPERRANAEASGATEFTPDSPELTSEHRPLITPPPSPIPIQAQPSSRTTTGAAAATATDEQKAPLFTPTEANDLRSRWDSVQASFVDQPRNAVEEADELVSVTMKRLEEIFSDERQKMEQQWGRGGDASTEDYRRALRRYRSFFTRLLSI
ncbi:MAG TPA: hypothetical protein VG322_17935 [Candidatus Acidoferrales bacterium]|jgi:hypothetical protein|nr:hypothetical protein [Candidatus Acidoferrales bacterium]